MGLKQKMPMRIRLLYRDFRSLIWLIFASHFLKNKKYPQIRFMSNTEAVDEIVLNGKSLARFGDGEFSWVLNKDISGEYQELSDELSTRLSRVLATKDDRLLLGVLKVLNDDSGTNFRAKSYWRKFKALYQESIMRLIDLDQVYVDSSITRPYIDMKNKQLAPLEFDNLKRIWAGKSILLVEGDESRLGVGNDLFLGAKSISRILCPSRNAFDRYDEILSRVLERAKGYDLVLLALGPTATIMACDLCLHDQQAVDIGHIDNEYEWMLMGTKRKVPIVGKAVDEIAHWGLERLDDEAYKKSIVERIV